MGGFVSGIIASVLDLILLIYVGVVLSGQWHFDLYFQGPELCLFFVSCWFLTLPLGVVAITLGAISMQDITIGRALPTPLAKAGFVLGIVSSGTFVLSNVALIVGLVVPDLYIFRGV